MDMEKKDLLIRMWATPNPYALKFVVNCPLKNRGRATLATQADCVSLPLFHSLFDIPGIKQIFVFQNQLTVTHDGSLSEEDMEQKVKSVMETRMAIHNPDFRSFEEEQAEGDTKKPHPEKKSADPEVLKVESILDHHIRPGLRADGGDIEVLSVEGDEVRISYQGACGGCPSALMGTLEAIEGILRQETGRDKLSIIPV